MKNLLLISFNVVRDKEPKTPYSIAALMASLKSDKRYGTVFEAKHFPINIRKKKYSAAQVVEILQAQYQLDKFQFIAISDFVWCTALVIPVIKRLHEIGWKGKTIVGGCQPTSTPPDKIEEYYGEVDFVIKGFAEDSLLELLTNEPAGQKVLFREPKYEILPSVYLSKEIKLTDFQAMIRWETKRGCAYKCDFCEWKNYNPKGRRFVDLPKERLVAELELFKKHMIGKINVLDAEFNVGKQYLGLLREMIRVPTVFSLQIRLELLNKKGGREFLELCSMGGNIVLECGIQSIHEDELRFLGRHQRIDDMEKALKQIRHYQIPFFVDLISRIPGQTNESLKESLHFLHKCGVKRDRIRIYHLRVPRGSEMEKNKSEYGIIEENETDVSPYGIPVVVGSNMLSKEGRIRLNRLEFALHPFPGSSFNDLGKAFSIRVFRIFEIGNTGSSRQILRARSVRFYFRKRENEIDIRKHLLGLVSSLGGEKSRRLTADELLFDSKEEELTGPIFIRIGLNNLYSCLWRQYSEDTESCNLFVRKIGAGDQIENLL